MKTEAFNSTRRIKTAENVNKRQNYARQIRDESGMGVYNHRSKSPLRVESKIKSDVVYDRYMHQSKENNRQLLNQYGEWKYNEADDKQNENPNRSSGEFNNTQKQKVNYAISYDKNLQPESIREKVKRRDNKPPRDDNRPNMTYPNRSDGRDCLQRNSRGEGEGYYSNPREHNNPGSASASRDNTPFNNNSLNYNYNTSMQNNTIHNSSYNNNNFSHVNDSNLYDVDKNVRTIIEYKNNMIDHLEKCKGSKTDDRAYHRNKSFDYDMPKTYIDYKQPDIIYEENQENNRDLSNSNINNHRHEEVRDTADFNKTKSSRTSDIKEVSFKNTNNTGNHQEETNTGGCMSSYTPAFTPSERNKGKFIIYFRPVSKGKFDQ
jgi:hypothetical protein